MDEAPPLIVTLEAEPTSQAAFARARARWFPLSRQLVPAHLTLFNKLPGGAEPEIAARMAGLSAATAPMPFRVAAIMPLGGGCAFRLDLPGLEALRGRVAAGLDLAPQDRGRRRPHVTIQNKVRRDVAATVLQGLQSGFVPWEGRMERLRLWRYVGGPWEMAGDWALAGAPPP
jgi:hypothetical protein